MEGEVEWEEELSSALMTRPRRNKEEQKGSEEMVEDVGEVKMESPKSVFFDNDEGLWKCHHCTWTYGMGSLGIDNIQNHEEFFHRGIEPIAETVVKKSKTLHWSNIEGEQENGTEFADNCLQIQNGFPATDNQITLVKAEIQSSSNSSNSEDYHEIETEESKLVRSVIVEYIPATQDLEIQQEVAEVDVKRVLKEQETYDLYCPNCHKCITKRVILRKRKRVPDLQGDEKKKRSEPTPDAEESMEPDQDKREVFTCLSCFSFFISTASGLKWIFGRKYDDENLQNRQRHAPNMDSMSSTSEQIDSKDLGNEPEESHVNNGGRATTGPLNIHEASNESHSLGRENHIQNGEKLLGEAKQKPAASGLKYFWIFGWKGDKESLENGHASILNSMSSASEQIDSKNPGNEPEESHVSNGDRAYTGPFKVVDGIDGLNKAAGPVGESHIQNGEKLLGATIQNPAGVNLSLVQGIDVKWNQSRNLPEALFEGKTDAFISVPNAQLPEKVSNYNNGQMKGPEEIPVDNKEKLDGSFITSSTGNDITPEIEGPSDYEHFPSQRNSEILLDPKDQILGKTKPKHSEDEKSFVIPTKPDVVLSMEAAKYKEVLKDAPTSDINGSDLMQPLINGSREPIPVTIEILPASATPGISVLGEAVIDISGQIVPKTATAREWDVLKSIVYGGLIESITSLGVVSSAAGSDATILNIIVLGLANLIGGLFMLAHDLRELIKDQREILEPKAERSNRYFKTLGLSQNYRLHAFVAVVSYIMFGILPPIIYGFSFRESDNKEYKLIAVAGASLLCVLLLAIGKAHVDRPQKSYIKTILYYMSIAVASSGLSYVVGELLRRLLEKLGLFDSTAAGTVPPSSTAFMQTWETKSGWTSY